MYCSYCSYIYSKDSEYVSTSLMVVKVGVGLGRGVEVVQVGVWVARAAARAAMPPAARVAVIVEVSAQYFCGVGGE
jgi:hypothetical protein